MPFGLICDTFHRHPKRRHGSLEADGVLVRAISFCAEHLTDGYVRDEWLAEQLPPRWRFIRRWRIRRDLTRPLPPNGNPILHRAGGGWLVHDYLAINKSREQVEADRADARQRQADSRARKRGAAPPEKSHVTSGSGDGLEEQPTQRPTELPAPAPVDGEPPDDLRSRYPWPLGEVLEVLSKVERWAQVELYTAGLQSVIDANPGRPAVKGAHLTAARGNDPGFRTQSPIKAFNDVMRTLDAAEDKPTGSTGQNVLRIDRRCRRCKVREVDPGYGAYCEQCSEELAS